jgi:hypothetical protein
VYSVVLVAAAHLPQYLLSSLFIALFYFVCLISHSINHAPPQTLGVEVCVKPVKIPDTDVTVEMFLFDTSGSELYTQMYPDYVRGCCYGRS